MKFIQEVTIRTSYTIVHIESIRPKDTYERRIKNIIKTPERKIAFVDYIAPENINLQYQSILQRKPHIKGVQYGRINSTYRCCQTNKPLPMHFKGAVLALYNDKGVQALHRYVAQEEDLYKLIQAEKDLTQIIDVKNLGRYQPLHKIQQKVCVQLSAIFLTLKQLRQLSPVFKPLYISFLAFEELCKTCKHTHIPLERALISIHTLTPKTL